MTARKMNNQVLVRPIRMSGDRDTLHSLTPVWAKPAGSVKPHKFPFFFPVEAIGITVVIPDHGLELEN
jgi:hypothetical protein